MHGTNDARSGQACLAKTEARRRASQVGRVDYTLDLLLTPKTATYRGDLTADFDLKGDPSGLFLDFQGQKVLEATVNGAPAALEPRGHRIALPAERLRAGRNLVRVVYENEYDRDGSGLYKATDPADGLEYVFSDCEPFNANRFFPCFDQPDLKATYAVTVTAPADWVVVANGAEAAADPVEGGVRRRFARTPRFSTYVVAVCAGPYQVWTDGKARIPARILARRSMAPFVDHEEIFELTRQGFDFFESYFGIPYPYGKYDQVFVPDYNMGAMENVACVVHSDRMLYRHSPTDRERRVRAITVLHEMAHMWFGDLVTMEWWDDLWLNESFATYMATLALVRATRFKDGFEAFRQDEKRWAYWQDELPTTHPIAAEVPDTVNAFTNFDGITYGKGASVLKQLSFWAGEEAFRSGVSDYLRAHAEGNARLEHFLGAIGRAAGRDLGPWAKAWLSTSGVNGIAPKVRVQGGRVAEVALEQTPGNGDGVLRPHRLLVAAYAAGPGGDPVLARTADVRIEGAAARASALEGLENPLFLVVNHDDHAYAKAYLDEVSLRYATQHLERLPGSFLRTEVWAAVWTMVRDRLSPPTAFLDLFLAKAALETNDKVVSSLLRNLAGTLNAYLPDRLRADAVERSHALARRRVEEAPAGSDLQKAWFDGLLLSSESRAALDHLDDLLTGRARVPGLPLEQEHDRRWAVVVRLSAFGHPQAARRLEEARTADKSERAERSAFRALVARPDPAEKARAWERFCRDREARLDLLREGMGAFHWPHQKGILAPFVARYFEDLPAAAAGRDLHFGQAFANGLFPGSVVEEATAEQARAFLKARGDLAAHLRRAVVERLADLERALAVRATVRA